MQTQRRRDTTCEMSVRRRLHHMGFRYRVDYRPEATLRRSADIVFSRQRIAVFIDGCFWHGCPEHGTTPKSNGDWWAAKIERTRQRDLDTTSILISRGWTVLRFWEHQSPDEVASEVAQAVEARRRRGAPCA